jgi:hypothetical protein
VTSSVISFCGSTSFMMVGKGIIIVDRVYNLQPADLRANRGVAADKNEGCNLFDSHADRG